MLWFVYAASKDGVMLPDKDGLPPAGDEQYRCQMCNKSFVNIDALCTHQNEQGHLELKDTPRGPGYLCWKKGCNQYFKSAHTLQVSTSQIITSNLSCLKDVEMQ